MNCSRRLLEEEDKANLIPLSLYDIKHYRSKEITTKYEVN